MLDYLKTFSNLLIPTIFFIVLIYGYFKDINLYKTFIKGAEEGLETVAGIFPYLLAMLVAINVFQSSGGLKFLLDLLQPFFRLTGIPGEITPLLFLRPLSGSGSLSYVNKLINSFGPDSYIGKLASTIQGSTETTFYIVTVYFGAAGIKNYRYAIITGLLADITGFLAAVYICSLMF